MTLSPIAPRESAVSACALALKEAILRSELAPGSRLPPERKLAETFGVNRVTVRSALTQLEAAHLVSVRQGSGYVVRDYRLEGGPDLIASLVGLARGASAFASIASDVLLVRRQLARGLLEKLAARAPLSSAARGRITAAIDTLACAAESGDLEVIANADLAVVAALVSETDSPVLQLCMNPVSAVLRELPSLRAAMYREPALNVESYRAVLAWLEAGRPDLIEIIVAELEKHDRATVQALGDAKPKKRTRS